MLEEFQNRDVHMYVCSRSFVEYRAASFPDDSQITISTKSDKFSGTRRTTSNFAETLPSRVETEVHTEFERTSKVISFCY